MTAIAETVLARLLRKARSSECWIWKGALDLAGYGKIGSSREDGTSVTLYAHRAMYESVHGPVPEWMLVMHTCNRPACINPSHLRVGTHADNSAQRDREGRNQYDRAGRPYLTPERHLEYQRARRRKRKEAERDSIELERESNCQACGLVPVNNASGEFCPECAAERSGV